MSDDQGPFGIEELDRLISNHMPTGGAIEIHGPPGCGKTMMGLGFLSHGISQGFPGLYVNFTTVPILPLLLDRKDDPRIHTLMDYPEPLVLDMSKKGMLDILTPLIASGEVRNLVLEHPDILPLKGEEEWFSSLEAALTTAREGGVNVILLDYPGPLGQYLSGGIIEMTVGDDMRRRLSLLKWDWKQDLRGASIEEPEVGSWGI